MISAGDMVAAMLKAQTGRPVRDLLKAPGTALGKTFKSRAEKETSTNSWPLDRMGIRLRASGRIAVLGLARSGQAAARLLLDKGARCDLLDLSAPEDMKTVEPLTALGAVLRLGPHDLAWLDSYDLIVKSPGIPPGTPFLEEAARRGIPSIGELELGWLAAEGPVLAITGTNGKSTTTAWAGDMFKRAGLKVQVGGNIGRPFCDAVLADPRAVFVTEVSSFQLQDAPTFRPRVAVLLNLSPDHVDYHGSFEAYRQAKLSLFSRLTEQETAVVGPDDELAERALQGSSARRLRFRLEDRGEDGAFLRDASLWLRSDGRETRLLEREALSLPGPHNLENALAASAAAAALGVPPEAIADSLTSFPGLPHRLEPVGAIRGVRFVNDSKATNVDSLAVALRSFDQPVILIAGGRDKGQDFLPLRSLVEKQVRVLVLIGEGTERIAGAWSALPAHRGRTFREAVEGAFRLARPGETVLLSPACASFDMFRNYEDRGDQFRALVAELERQLPEDQPRD